MVFPLVGVFVWLAAGLVVGRPGLPFWRVGVGFGSSVIHGVEIADVRSVEEDAS